MTLERPHRTINTASHTIVIMLLLLTFSLLWMIPTNGSPVPLSCDQFCSQLTDVCNGTDTQYESIAACTADCASWPTTDIVDHTWTSPQNTFTCRIWSLYNAANITLADQHSYYCNAANGLSPICGTPCEQYCNYMTNDASACTLLTPTFIGSVDRTSFSTDDAAATGAPLYTAASCVALCNSAWSATRAMNTNSQYCHAAWAQRGHLQSNMSMCTAAQPWSSVQGNCTAAVAWSVAARYDPYQWAVNEYCGTKAQKKREVNPQLDVAAYQASCVSNLTSTNPPPLNRWLPNSAMGRTLECLYHRLISSPAVTVYESDWFGGGSQASVCSWSSCDAYCSTFLDVCTDTLKASWYGDMVPASFTACKAQCGIIASLPSPSVWGQNDTLQCLVYKLQLIPPVPTLSACINAAMTVTNVTTVLGTQCSTITESYCDRLMGVCGTYGVDKYGQYRSRDECMTMAALYPSSPSASGGYWSTRTNSLQCRINYSISNETCAAAGPLSLTCTSNTTTACDNHCQLIFTACNTTDLYAIGMDSVVQSWGGTYQRCMDICNYLPRSPSTYDATLSTQNTMACRSMWPRYAFGVNSTNVVARANYCVQSSLYITADDTSTYPMMSVGQQSCGTRCDTYCQLWFSVCNSTLYNYTSYSACFSQCNAMATDIVSESFLPIVNGSSIQCRFNHLVSAAGYRSQLTNLAIASPTRGLWLTHCNAASGTPTAYCTSPAATPATPTIVNGSITTANCTRFCQVAMRLCWNVLTLQWQSTSECELDCYTWPLGFSSALYLAAPSSHTLWCRIKYLNDIINGSMPSPYAVTSTQCNKIGGLSTVCGSTCDHYCNYMTNENSSCTTLTPSFTASIYPTSVSVSDAWTIGAPLTTAVTCASLCNTTWNPSRSPVSPTIQLCHATWAQRGHLQANISACAAAQPWSSVTGNCSTVPWHYPDDNSIPASPYEWAVNGYCGMKQQVCRVYGGAPTRNGSTYGQQCVTNIMNSTGLMINPWLPNSKMGRTLECLYHRLTTYPFVACSEYDSFAGSQSLACTWSSCDAYCSTFLDICTDVLSSSIYSNIVPTSYQQCLQQCGGISSSSSSYGDTLQCLADRLQAITAPPTVSSCIAAAMTVTNATSRFGTQCATLTESYCDRLMTVCGTYGTNVYGQYRSRDECLTMVDLFDWSVSYDTNSLCRANYASSPSLWTQSQTMCAAAGPYSSSCTNNTCEIHCQLIFDTCNTTELRLAGITTVAASWGGTYQRCIDICNYLPGSDSSALLLDQIDSRHTMTCRSLWARYSLSPINASQTVTTRGEYCTQSSLYVTRGTYSPMDQQCGTTCDTYCQLWYSVCNSTWYNYTSYDACIEQCASMAIDLTVTSEPLVNGSSIQCRFSHLVTAAGLRTTLRRQGFDLTVRATWLMHCNAASNSPSEYCIGNVTTHTDTTNTIASANCTLFCNAAMSQCSSASTLQWQSTSQCLRDCQSWPTGVRTDSSSHSLWCRINYMNVILASSSSSSSGVSAGLCGMIGGLSTVCGSTCDHYCNYMQYGACATVTPTFNAPYAAMACTTLCNSWALYQNMSSAYYGHTQLCHASHAQSGQLLTNGTLAQLQMCQEAQPWSTGECTLGDINPWVTYSPMTYLYCSTFISLCGTRTYQLSISNGFESLEACLNTMEQHNDVYGTMSAGAPRFGNMMMNNSLQCRYYYMVDYLRTHTLNLTADEYASYEFCNATGEVSTELCAASSCTTYCTMLDGMCGSIATMYQLSGINDTNCNRICRRAPPTTLSCRMAQVSGMEYGNPAYTNFVTCAEAALYPPDYDSGWSVTASCTTPVAAYCDAILTTCGVFSSPFVINASSSSSSSSSWSSYVTSYGQYVSRDECIAMAGLLPLTTASNGLSCHVKHARSSFNIGYGDDRRLMCSAAGPFSYDSCTTSRVVIPTSNDTSSQQQQQEQPQQQEQRANIFQDSSNNSQITMSPFVTMAMTVGWNHTGEGCDNHCRLIFGVCNSVTSSVLDSWGGNETACIEICRYLPMNTSLLIDTLLPTLPTNSMNCRSYGARVAIWQPSMVSFWCDAASLMSSTPSVYNTSSCGAPCDTWCTLYTNVCNNEVIMSLQLGISSFGDWSTCMTACNNYAYTVGDASLTSGIAKLSASMTSIIRASYYMTSLVTTLIKDEATVSGLINECNTVYTLATVLPSTSVSPWNFISAAIIIPLLGVGVIALCVWNRYKSHKEDGHDEPPPVLAEQEDINRDLNFQTPEALELAVIRGRLQQEEDDALDRAQRQNEQDLEQAMAESAAEYNASVTAQDHAVRMMNDHQLHLDDPSINPVRSSGNGNGALLNDPMPRIASAAAVGAAASAPSIDNGSGEADGKEEKREREPEYIVSPSLMDPADAAAAVAAANAASPISTGNKDRSGSTSTNSNNSDTNGGNDDTTAAGAGAGAVSSSEPNIGPYGCCICYERAADHCVLDCGHLCMCRRCVGLLLQSGGLSSRRCPKCRGPILRIVRIYV